MAQDDLPRLIPTADHERESIAARYTIRVRRIFGTSDTAVPSEPAVLPVFLSVDEVIGLIAYGRTAALSGPAPGAPPIFERWKRHLNGGSIYERQYPLVQQMRLVLARVWWWKSNKRKRACPTDCPIRPLDRVARGHVRWAIRSHGKSGVGTVALLRTDVRRLLAAQTAHQIAIDRAVAILCAEIAAEHIVAYGRPGVWRQRAFRSSLHEAIPSVFFANPHNTIQADGWATCGRDMSAQNWANGPDWGDVRFKRDDVLKLLPVLFGSGADMHADLIFLSTSLTDERAASGITDNEKRLVTMEELFAETRKQAAVRRRHQDRIIERLRHSREWTSFEDIAEWCAREKGSIEPDEGLRSETYRQLGNALAAGEFGLGRNSRVLFLHPRSNWAKMTSERFGWIPYGQDGRSSYLRYCWIPAELARCWFDSRNLKLPRHLFAPAPSNTTPRRGHAGRMVDTAGSVQTRSPTGNNPKLPVARAMLAKWYIERRDQWPAHRKHPSQDDDLTEARQEFPEHHVTREAVRSVRATHAHASWTKFGRRKLARK